jgi:hypothetical protein
MVLDNDPAVQGGTLMHHRIDTILKQLRQDVARRLEPESIVSACREAGHFWRKCILNPVAIVHWFVIQVSYGNTSLEHVARLSGGLFTGAAYCLARALLPLAVFQFVLRDLVKSLVPITDAEGLWRGHRTEAGMRVSGGQAPGIVPRRYRGAVESHGHAIALS